MERRQMLKQKKEKERQLQIHQKKFSRRMFVQIRRPMNHDDSSSNDTSDGQGGSSGHGIIIYDSFTGEFQFTHAIQNRDHDARLGRAREHTIAYRRWAPQGQTTYDAAKVDNIACAESLDVFFGFKSFTESGFVVPSSTNRYGYAPYRLRVSTVHI